ncbi:MAG: DNA polymerase I [Deltaproteobacteria bacterium]|nr:DNA polymerase I [Deltaproteobacteria bacterium]
MNKNLAPIYLIDGSSYIFRAYYAIRGLSNSQGRPTNATYGFTQMVLRLLKDHSPQYWAMILDSKEPSFRKQKYPKYKANREVPPEDLVPQFEDVRRVTRALNIPMLEMPGFEADDIIATLARHYEKQKHPVVIVSGDKDLMQLVDPQIYLLDTMKDKEIHEAEVKEKFGVPPSQVLDVLALAGDSSDNIPGVPGIGPKTASQLIAEYQSLEGLYEHLDEIKGKKQENLKNFREQAFLSQWLVRLCEDVPVETGLEKYAYQEWDVEACHKIFSELEFTQLLKNFELEEKKEKSERTSYQLIQNEEAWKNLLQKIDDKKCMAVDTETTSLDIHQAQLVGIAIALEAEEAYYIPLGHEVSDEQLDLKKVLSDLKGPLEDPQVEKYFQNYKYDAGVFLNYKISVKGLKLDTMLASYILDPAQSHKLDNLALKYLQHSMISYQEVTGEKKGGEFKKVDLAAATQYSAEDADMTWQLAKCFEPQLSENDLDSVLKEIEQPLSEVLLRMERHGIKIDLAFLKKLQKEFQERILKKEENIYALAGEEFNIQSPKQLGVILFEKLELPILKKTKTGPSTNVEVLTELAKSHALPQEILDYRSLAKLQSTYVDALLQIAHAETQRVHTSFNQTIAETGRLSSSDPNLQNIPIRSSDGAKIRQAFIAESGFVLMSADYSQIELRVLAQLSQDPALIEAFAEDLDIHRLTASRIFQVSEEQVTANMRAAGKTVNFAVIYGQSPFGLSKQLGVSQKEAKSYIEQYFMQYQGVKTYREKILEGAKARGEVRTLMGRRRFVHEINSGNFMVRSNAERIAFNTVIQGTAADLIKKAMIDLDRAIMEQDLKTRLLLQVHDELVVEVPQEEIQTMESLLRSKMEDVVDFEIPLKVSIAWGKNWAEAHS